VHYESVKIFGGKRMKLYRPSNGTEGEMFQEKNCLKCVYWGIGLGCPIYLQTIMFAVDEDDYPNQWRYDKDDKPICNCFWGKK